MFPGLGRKWSCYRSPNFEMYSSAGDGDSRDALEHLELLRAVFLDTFKVKVRLPLPATVFYFNSDRDFHGYWPPEYSGNKNYVGFCYSWSDRTVISLGPAQNEDAARQTVYHEFIHYLVRITGMEPAPWFDEGVADLYSTVKDEDGVVKLGLPVEGRVRELRQARMMPLEQLFSISRDSSVFRESDRTGIFYAESWAFLHYCLCGVSKLPRERLDAFLRLASTPESQRYPERLRRVCQELLGYDYPQLTAQLEDYINHGQYKWGKTPRPQIADKKTYSRRPVPREEMSDRLAELSLRITRSPYAKLALLQSLGHSVDDVRLCELLGTLALYEGDEILARERWTQAVESGTTNAAIFRELGRIEANRRFSTFDYYYRLPEADARYLRSLLQRSLAAAPDQNDGYEMLAWVEATSARPDVANVNLVQRHFPALKDKPRTLLALVLVRLRAGDRPTAAALLDELDKMHPPYWVAVAAETVRSQLENRPPRSLAAPAEPPATIQVRSDLPLSGGK